MTNGERMLEQALIEARLDRIKKLLSIIALIVVIIAAVKYIL